MKRKSIFKLIPVLLAAVALVIACTKESSDVRLAPTLATSQVINLSADSATIVGYVVASGSGFSQRGVCFDTLTGPTTDRNKVVYSGQSTLATFNVRVGGLKRLTKYYARAYAVNSSGTIYGDEITFKTIAAIPTLAEITNDSLTLANTTDKGITVTTKVNITDDGGPDPTANITARGVVYSMYPHPTVDSMKTVEGTGKGSFSSLATMLKGNVTYYLRAYATNKIGTGYSTEVSFSTPVAFATVNTVSVTQVAKTTATFKGLVTSNGGGTIAEQGFVYGLNANPTTADTKVPVTSSTDTLVYNATGLSVNTNYHMRAYVINDQGTNYGADLSFTTLADITKLWVVGDYNGWDNSDNAKYIINTVTSGGQAEGYVNLTNVTNGFKLTTDHSWDNAHTFGDDGTNTGKLSNVGGGSNIKPPSTGYYLIQANLTTMTYSFVLTNWGLIGDATPGGWGAQTDMTYMPSTGIFKLGITLTGTKSIKFRGTSDWAINYGSTTADGTTLDAGGSNITVPASGDYAITLDLSHPNAYTYSANTWAIIGDATAGGWSTDTPMTWDAGNQVFTVTGDLGAGSFKFRANQAWTVNLGGSLGALTQGGDNLSIATAGNYTITLDPWALTATVTQNKK